jgi:hypothetical protein
LACPPQPIDCDRPGRDNSQAKSIRQIRDQLDDRKDKIVWRVLNGAPASQLDYGSPPAGTTHTMCMYSGNPGDLIYELEIQPGSNWKTFSTQGWKYKDGDLTPVGVHKVSLIGHALLPQSKILFKGKRENLPDLAPNTLPFDGLAGAYPITVLLVNDTNMFCWTSVFESNDFKKNTGEQFKAIDRP